MEWKENGNGMEKYQQKISMQNGMEMERKWNGKKLLPQLGSKVKWSGMETESKWNGETIATSDRNN